MRSESPESGRSIQTSRLRPVGGDVEPAIVEGGLAVRDVLVGVVTAEELEAQVGGGAANSADDVLVSGLHPGAEVQGVGVVQTHLGEGSGAGLQERVVAVVVEGDMGAVGDTAGEVLQALQQIGLGLDERRLTNQLLGFGDGVQQRLRVHA